MMIKNFSQCLTESQLEDYAFGRVQAEAVADVEEHLMVCSECQDRLQAEEEYIAAFRSAARSAQRQVEWHKWVAAAACLVLAVGLWMPFRSVPVESVDLRAERGGTVASAGILKAGHKAELRIDLAGLENRHVKRLQVVSAAGAPLAETVLDGSTTNPTWSLDRKLDAGTYWVRAFDASGTQLREFKLEVD